METCVPTELVPAVGGDTAKLLTLLAGMKGLEFTQVHFIGHGLGAHVAGFAGKNIHARLGRITGEFMPGSAGSPVSARQARQDRW